MIVERQSFAPVARVPLPEPVRAVLSAIGDDLRHAPRDCFVDRAELVHWLARMARRIDGVAAMTVPGPKRESPSRPRYRYADIARVTPREAAEAVFRGAKPRTITSRKGRQVRVEVRRSMQFEMGF